MDFRNVTKINIQELQRLNAEGEVVKITSNGDILWAKKLNVDIQAYPEDYGTIVINPTNDNYYYGQTISYKVIPKDSSKIFLQWSDDSTNKQHSSITLSSDYIDIAMFQTDILSDYFDSEEATKNKWCGLLYLRAGTYRVMTVGHGGGGGRSNWAWYQQGAFGGGSGAAISGYMNLTSNTYIQYNVGRSWTKASTIKTTSDSNQKISIKANGGSNGTYGDPWFHSYGGAGGQIKSDSTTGMITADTKTWNGISGTAVNNGKNANGGCYATELIEFNGHHFGGGANHSCGYSNLTATGTSYDDYNRGYVHIERVYDVVFKGYQDDTLTTLKSYKYIRRNTSVTAPTVPSRTGYNFTGWVPVLAPIVDNTTFTAQYEQQTFTVTFDHGYDNQKTIKDNVKYGTTIGSIKPTISRPTTDGTQYTFTGWNKSDSTVVTSNLTVTAQWSSQKVPCTITYKKYDGSILSTITVDYGTAYNTTTVPSVPERTGYTPSGWGTPSPASAITNGKVVGSCTFTAQYKEIEVSHTVLKLNIPDIDDCVLNLDTSNTDGTLLELKE